MQFLPHHTNRSYGFTLIELMVVISISSVVAFSGFFAFNKYAESQKLERAVQDIKTAYQQARFNAVSSVKDESGGPCSPLKGYRVNMTTNAVTVLERCGNSPTTERAYHTYTMPPGITIMNFDCNTITFNVLTGGTTGVLPCPGGSLYIKVQSSTGAFKNLKIDYGGIIKEY